MGRENHTLCGYLIENNKKSGTIKSYISAIKSVLHDDGVSISENRLLLNSLIKACKYKNDRVHTRLPIRRNLLKLLLDALDNLYPGQQPYLTILYKAVFVAAYFGMFRVGELTQSIHAVKARDVHIGRNKNKIMFVLRTSKTHWSDVKPQVIKINGKNFEPTGKRKRQKQSYQKKNDKSICPFSLLKKYVQIRGPRATENEQFFIFSDGTPVTPVNFTTTLKEVLRLCGLDHSLYTVHGFRAGRSLDLLAMNISVETIRKLGRWTSGAIYTYLRY